MRRGSAVERFMPLAYFALAFALVAVLLPSALRPPPQQPPSSAQLDPNAPPDDDAVILSELGRGTSGTAGSGVEAAGEVVTATAPRVELRPRKGRCFGDPPRQVESLYAPPCVSAFVGTNDGATYRGVTASEVRVGIIRGGATAWEGYVDAAPDDQVDDTLRTYRVWQEYFNRNFELAGRRLRLVIASTSGQRSGSERGAVAKMDDEYGVFAIVGAATNGEPETIRRKLVLFGGINNDQGHYDKASPYAYSFKIDGTKLVKLLSEFMCKQVHGRKAWFAGDPVFNGRDRKIGIIQYHDATHYQYAEQFERDYAAQCGGKVAERLFYNAGDLLDDGLQIMTKFKAAEVTTILWMGEYIGAAVATAQGTQQGYFPEWIHAGGGGTDVNANAQLLEKGQWRNAIGITSLEMAMQRNQLDFYRAYKSVDPEGEPEGANDFPELLQLVGGLQLAGSKLTPETFQKALFTAWPRRAPVPQWTIGGGYGPGDYTYPDYVAIEWWDPAAVDPTTGRPGAYRHVLDGKRFTLTEIPRGALPFFKEGMHEPPAEVQR